MAGASAPENRIAGIGGSPHFAADVGIGLQLGWGGPLDRVRQYGAINRRSCAAEPGFYEGLEAVVLGSQHWVGRHAEAAREMARRAADRDIRANLEQIAKMSEWLIVEPRRTFGEACQ